MIVNVEAKRDMLETFTDLRTGFNGRSDSIGKEESGYDIQTASYRVRSSTVSGSPKFQSDNEWKDSDGS